MFVMGNLSYDCVGWKLFQHDVNVNQGITSSEDKDNWSFDISGWEFGNLGVFADAAERYHRLDVVIIHLKALSSDNLKPMNHTLRAGKRVQMRVGG